MCTSINKNKLFNEFNKELIEQLIRGVKNIRQSAFDNEKGIKWVLVLKASTYIIITIIIIPIRVFHDASFVF